jgi:hypothetical protein
MPFLSGLKNDFLEDTVLLAFPDLSSFLSVAETIVFYTSIYVAYSIDEKTRDAVTQRQRNKLACTLLFNWTFKILERVIFNLDLQI